MSLEQSYQYEKEVLTLKDKYKNDIEILLAYEVDYMSNNQYIEEKILNSNVDYLIGSVHFLDTWGFDNPEYLKEYENKNIDDIWINYFNTIEEMAKTNYFNIVGHLDLIKVFKFLPKKDIKSIAYKALKQIKKSNMTIEVNSAGLRKPIKEQYPSRSLLELAYELDIDITFSSDAHSIEQIGFGYENNIRIAKSIGFKNCVSYIKKEKIYHKL
jgi:histidinol-phosphatase (PHP family)